MFLKRLNTSLRIKFLILFVTILCIIIMLPQGKSIESEVTVGSIWLQEDLIADLTFPIKKDEITLQHELKETREKVLPVFSADDQVAGRMLDSLNRYHSFIRTKFLYRDITANESLLNLTFLSDASFNLLQAAFSKPRQRSGSESIHPDTILHWINAITSKCYAVGVVEKPVTGFPSDTFNIRKKNIDVPAEFSLYINYINKQSSIENLVRASRIPEMYHKLVSEYVNHFIIANYKYRADLTQEERLEAEKKVSKITGIVNENEKIIGKHERVTPDIKRKIDSYRQMKGEMLKWSDKALQFLGKFLHILGLLILFSIYLFLFRKNIYNNNLKLAIFSLLLIWICFVAFLVNQLNVTDALQFIILIPAASMLMTIMFDSRVGFYSTIIISLICGGMMGNNYPFVVTNIVAGVLAVYTVRDIRNRTQIFRSFFFILLGYLLTIIAFGLERFAPFKQMLVEMGFAATNALISPVLTFGFLIFFEKIFKTTTDFTLLELSNYDHSLLRELNKKAPGTFGHSLILGTLAESAASAIGANTLLARVGAYYHDIGKLISPKYFVENQSEERNIHDEINPEESIRIIREHVSRGIELAREKGLPTEVINFIPMHHGTTLISYFFEKAKKTYGEENISEKDYRYLGPKPNSKETAIVMLADSCESAVRSMDDPENEKIENLVRNLIDARIADGQLDDSTLTFRDVLTIKEAFIEILQGQNYRRIRYPGQDIFENTE